MLLDLVPFATNMVSKNMTVSVIMRYISDVKFNAITIIVYQDQETCAGLLAGSDRLHLSYVATMCLYVGTYIGRCSFLAAVGV